MTTSRRHEAVRGRNRRAWLYAVLAVLIGGALGLNVYRGLRISPSPCSVDELARTRSPDSAREAVVVVVDCGATTDYSTQVGVVPAGARPARNGEDVFVADTDHGAAPAGRGGGPVVRVRWTGARALTIAYDHRARTFREIASRRGVTIRYERF
jgi:hypothetical protein